MKLIDVDLDVEILEDKDLFGIIGEIISVKMFHLVEYSRDYDVFRVEGEKNTVILKKVREVDEIKTLEYLSSLSLDFIPKVYFEKKIKDDYWLCLSYAQEKHEETMKKNDFMELLSKLFEIHHKSVLTSGSELKEWKADSNDSLNDLVGPDITDEEVEVLKFSTKILEKSSKTIIHGDMIPLNTIKTDDGVNIIDFGHTQKGPYILDLGRLLGDFNLDVKWVNDEWEYDLVNFYYDLYKDKYKGKCINEFKLEYECSKLYNYLGLVLAFKSRNATDNKWYDLNLSEMKKSISVVKSYKTS